MNTTTQLAPAHSPSAASRRPEHPIEMDHGPWLFLVAPVSFAMVLLTIIYLARISF